MHSYWYIQEPRRRRIHPRPLRAHDLQLDQLRLLVGFLLEHPQPSCQVTLLRGTEQDCSTWKTGNSSEVKTTDARRHSNHASAALLSNVLYSKSPRYHKKLMRQPPPGSNSMGVTSGFPLLGVNPQFHALLRTTVALGANAIHSTCLTGSFVKLPRRMSAVHAYFSAATVHERTQILAESCSPSWTGFMCALRLHPSPLVKRSSTILLLLIPLD
jgi:hypothetical protein